MDPRTDTETADTNTSEPLEPFGDLQKRNERRARIARLLATQRERRRRTVKRFFASAAQVPLALTPERPNLWVTSDALKRRRGIAAH